MYLRTLASFGAIVPGSRSRLRPRLQRAAINDHRRRLRLAPCELAQQRTHIHQDLEDPGPYSALRLLIDHRLGRKIARHETPLVAGARDVAKVVEHRPQRMLALRRVLPAQGQIRCHKRPLLVAHIARVLRRILLLPLSMLNERTKAAQPVCSTGIKVNNRL
jgi:hypothetical protein